MSRELLESILNKDYVSAKELFEQKLSDIQEKKMYEVKRMHMAEAFGMLKFTKAEIEAKKAAGYRKATDVLGDPSKNRMKPLVKIKKKTVKEESLDENVMAGAEKMMRTVRSPGLKGKFARYMVGKYRQITKDQQQNRITTSDDEAMARAAGAEPSHAPKSADAKRPGIIKRNVNTLMGRSPSYVKPETPESEKGGRLGKGIRMAGKGVGKAWGLWGDVLRSGSSGNLEE